MSEPEQWRFQWPDGTWIRWNPQTQAWEKEPVRPDEPAAAQRADEPPPEEDAAPEEDPAVADAGTDGDRNFEADPYIAPRVDKRSSRSRRTLVADVLPPTEEPGRPGGSLWPTIFTGMVVGLGVGLLLWNVIR